MKAEEVSAAINELRKNMNERFDQLNEKIDQVETNLEKTLNKPKSEKVCFVRSP
jgi:hypothetical protein